MLWPIVFLLFLIILSAIFSASETALMSLSQAKVMTLVDKKVPGAKIVEKLKNNPHRLLITVLVGNTFVNIAASVYAGAFFTEVFGHKGLGLATGFMTLFILVFAEITPKSFAAKYATSFALFLGPFLLGLQFLLSPIVWIFDSMIGSSMKLFKAKYQTHSVTEDEIIAMASIGEAEGSINRQEKEFIENVLEFNDIEVREIMRPRTEIEALSSELTIRQCAEQILRYHHTRLPVFDKNLDNIVAIISVKDVFQYMHSQDIDKKLKSLNLPAPYEIPLSKKISRLFHELKKRRIYLAVVIDEYGGTAGIVTMKDILEEIVGEIVDDLHPEENLIKPVSKNIILAQGKTPVYQIEEFLKVQIGHNPEEDYKPINSLILDELHRFPRLGEIIKLSEVHIKIEKKTKKKIEEVRITKIKS